MTSSTKDQLIEAAAHLFNTVGYDGTNTNKIAQHAGFAPQTFYRHFDDKCSIFLYIYARWSLEEEEALQGLLAQKGGRFAHEAARYILDHHREWQVFRRSLRQLALRDEAVRSARRESQRRQATRLTQLELGDAYQLIIEVEALCNASIDGHVEGLGLSEDAWLERIAARIEAAFT